MTRFDEILNDLQDAFGVHPLWQELADVHRQAIHQSQKVLKAHAAFSLAFLDDEDRASLILGMSSMEDSSTVERVASTDVDMSEWLADPARTLDEVRTYAGQLERIVRRDEESSVG